MHPSPTADASIPLDPNVRSSMARTLALSRIRRGRGVIRRTGGGRGPGGPAIRSRPEEDRAGSRTMTVIAHVVLENVSRQQYDAVRTACGWLEHQPDGGL